MTWYTASIITAICTFDDNQELIPVFEDFFLIEAVNRDEAFQKAKYIGKELASLDDAVSFEDKPAKRLYLGIRKLRSIYNPSPYDIDLDKPVDGTELTHSYFEVQNIEEAKKLANGEIVTVSYVDDCEE